MPRPSWSTASVAPSKTVGRKSSPAPSFFHQRAIFQRVGSMRHSALYSLCRRAWSTSNWSGPTAARIGRRISPSGPERIWNSRTTPSCRSCFTPSVYFLELPGLGLWMKLNTSGAKVGISLNLMVRSVDSVSPIPSAS